jgi:hypothetical protein
VDAQPRGQPNVHSVVAVALRFVGTSIQPGLANTERELSPELTADIFAGVREFIGKNEERISVLLRQHY